MNSTHHFFLAYEFAEEGQWEQAARWYQRAFDGGLSHAAEDLVEVLLRLGRIDEAEPWARQAAESRPVPSTQRRLGEVLLRLGRLDEAERCARRAAESDPVTSRSLRLLADVLERQGKGSEATQWRRRSAQTIDPYPPSPPRWNWCR